MEKKKNSIEWLVEQLLSQHGIDITRLAVTDKAKAMHKKEIIDTWYNCKMSVIEKNPTTADQYYEQTFGGQDNE